MPSELTINCPFVEELKLCRQKRARPFHGYAIPVKLFISWTKTWLMSWWEYQIACSWSLSSNAEDFSSMKSQTASISSPAPASNPWESWKIKLLPEYVIWCSMLCIPLWKSHISVARAIHVVPYMYTPQLMGLSMDNLQKVQEVAFSPKDVWPL